MTAPLSVVERVREACARVAENVKNGFTANIRIDESEQTMRACKELVRDPDGPWVLNSNVADAIRALDLSPFVESAPTTLEQVLEAIDAAGKHHGFAEATRRIMRAAVSACWHERDDGTGSGENDTASGGDEAHGEAAGTSPTQPARASSSSQKTEPSRHTASTAAAPTPDVAVGSNATGANPVTAFPTPGSEPPHRESCLCNDCRDARCGCDYHRSRRAAPPVDALRAVAEKLETQAHASECVDCSMRLESGARIVRAALAQASSTPSATLQEQLKAERHKVAEAIMASIFAVREPDPADMARDPGPNTAWHWGWSAGAKAIADLLSGIPAPVDASRIKAVSE